MVRPLQERGGESYHGDEGEAREGGGDTPLGRWKTSRRAVVASTGLDGAGSGPPAIIR